MCSPGLLDVLRIQNHYNRTIIGRDIPVLVQPKKTSEGRENRKYGKNRKKISKIDFSEKVGGGNLDDRSGNPNRKVLGTICIYEVIVQNFELGKSEKKKKPCQIHFLFTFNFKN